MYRLKPDELQEIERFKTHHPQGKMLAEYLNWKFQIDDVLIRYHVDSNGAKSLDMVSDDCQVPKKFRVVKIDDLGIPWVKQLSVRGGLGNKLYCLMNYAGRFSWIVDPEQIDAMLLGYRYDPRIEYKRMRDGNPEYGGKTK
jgi:hypothetical protein